MRTLVFLPSPRLALVEGHFHAWKIEADLIPVRGVTGRLDNADVVKATMEDTLQATASISGEHVRVCVVA
jgi:hypothetical protein